jgi:hypothetical protein
MSAVTITQCLQTVSRFMGYGLTVPAGGTDALTDVQNIVERGLRQFYYPPPIVVNGKEEKQSHEWSFLKPSTTITFTAPVADTVAAGTGTTTLVASGTPFLASQVDAYVKFTGTGNSYYIASLTSDSEVELTTSLATADIDVGDAFTIYDGNYTLPVTFNGIVGDIYFQERTQYAPIQITGVNRIEQYRQDSGLDQSGRPTLAALRPTDITEDTDDPGQRWELLVWPAPDAAYICNYQTNAAPAIDMTTPSNYVLGGPAHAETAIQSCLAIAELTAPDAVDGKHRSVFAERLRASVLADRRLTQAEFLGYNHDRSNELDIDARRWKYSRLNPATLNGA